MSTQSLGAPWGYYNGIQQQGENQQVAAQPEHQDCAKLNASLKVLTEKMRDHFEASAKRCDELEKNLAAKDIEYKNDREKFLKIIHEYKKRIEMLQHSLKKTTNLCEKNVKELIEQFHEFHMEYYNHTHSFNGGGFLNLESNQKKSTSTPSNGSASKL